MKKGTYKDLAGQRFGRLIAIDRVGETAQGRSLWFCKCDCGGGTIVSVSDLQNGHTQSCGCIRKENTKAMFTKHGLRNTRLYCIWLGMKKRVTNPNSAYWECYGGRGIGMCDEWMNDFESFYNWSMSNGYADNLSIDRIDNDGDYEPSNCRWATSSEQALNRRPRKKVMVWDGLTM